ncbi:MAG: DivIVA domain-containing protein [Actinomycetota bacterium]
MEVSARTIQEKQFHDQWKGYNRMEVDDFLDRVAESVDRLTRENTDLRERIAELDQAVAGSRDTEEMLKKTLVTAQRAAEEAIAKAKAKAEELINEAEQRVRQTESETKERITAAETESRRLAASADADARRKVTEAESAARRMLADAERDSDARRRELEAHVAKLHAYEVDIKQRLKAFLQQQTRALEALTEAPAPAVGPAPAATPREMNRGARVDEPGDEVRETTPPWGAGAGAFGGPQSPEYADDEGEESDEEDAEGGWEPAAAGAGEGDGEGESVFEVPDEGDDEDAEDVHRRGVRDLFFRHQG